MKSKYLMIGAAVCAALFLFSGVMLYRQYADEKQSAEAFDNIAALVQDETPPADEPQETEPPQSEQTAFEKYAAVYEQNSDFVGWISIEGTNIDYPVMQTVDNPNYYLKRSFEKQYSDYGVPYVQEKDKWAIQDLFATDDDWRAALAKAKEFIPRITAFRGRLAESGAALLSFFRLDDEISLAFDALVHYAQRRSDEDTRVAAYQEMVSQVTRFAVEIQSAAAFETPELLAISDEDMNRLYAEAPELELYRLNIDRIRRRREHVLSDKEEAILAAAGEMAASPDDIYSMLNGNQPIFAPKTKRITAFIPRRVLPMNTPPTAFRAGRKLLPAKPPTSLTSSGARA